MLQVEESKQEKTGSGFSDFKVKLWKYQGETGALIPLLQSAQETYGYIPELAIDHISQIVGTPAAEIYGVITFYSQFRLRPTGKNLIKICDGTACHVNASSAYHQDDRERAEDRQRRDNGGRPVHPAKGRMPRLLLRSRRWS